MHGAMSLQNRVFADAHDVLYEDIRVEYDKNCLEPKYQASDDSVYTGKAGYMAPLFHAWIYPLTRVGGNRSLRQKPRHYLKEYKYLCGRRAVKASRNYFRQG